MQLTQQIANRIKTKLREVIKQEGIAAEVRSWVEFFGLNPRAVPIKQFARFVKASLTRKITNKEQQARIFAICDEINDLFPVSERYIKNKPTTNQQN